LGCGILSTYPQVANIAGLQGLLVYALAGGLPMLLFSFLGPKIRKQCPNGFVLTEWVFKRFGLISGLYLSACTILTIFLFMISEISSLQYAINTLTGLNALPIVIVECIVTSIYTSIGGFKVSFITDNIQISIVFILIIIISCSMGSYINIDSSNISKSHLLDGNKLGYQLIYILIIAIFTNDLFMSGFWLRTFASRTDKDLWIGTSIAAFLMTIIVTIIGITGLIAVWSNLIEVGSENSAASFFIILSKLPSWVMGFVLVFIISLSTCTLDSLQSALTSTISNDIFRNKIKIIYIRGIVILIIIPVIVIGLKLADDVLQIYFIADLLSASVIPIIILGLSSHFWFLTTWEVVGGGIGGLITVFIFGTIFYGNAKDGAKLLIIWNGIYGNDWSAFGAFVAAPFGSLISATIILILRISILKIYSLFTGNEFIALQKPNINELNDQADVSIIDDEIQESINSKDKSV